MKDKTVFWLSFFAAMSVFFAAATLSYGLFMSPLQPKEEKNIAAAAPVAEDTTFLVILRQEKRSLPFLFALVRLSPSQNKIGFTNLPNDLLLSFASRRDTPAQCYGYAGAKQVVRSLRLKNIDIHYYIDLTLTDLAAAIDKLGAVPFKVPKAVYAYDDKGLLKFKLRAGDTRLGGAMAAGMLKYTDLPPQEQTRLQIDLLAAMAGQYIKAGSFLSLWEYMDTDLNAIALQKLQKEAATFSEAADISFVTSVNQSPDSFLALVHSLF